MENAVKKTKVMYFAELKDMVMEAEEVTDELKDELVISLTSRLKPLKKERWLPPQEQKRRRLRLMP